MSWTKEIWEKSSKIYSAILELDFLKELAAGTLDSSKFDRYIAQDELYLGIYGRQMYELADMITEPEYHDMFLEFAKSGMEGEQAMHQLLIGRFGTDLNVTPSVVTSRYNSHTQKAVDSGMKSLALAAMLPCMWVYNEVGLHILGLSDQKTNPYAEWISEYGNDEFTQGVNTMLELADKYADEASEEVRKQMDEAFLEATLLELAFWDYGYNGESKNYDYIKSLEGWI